MPTLAHLSGTEIIRHVATGRASAVDVITEHLAQIERLNPQLNAFVEVRADQAIAEASAQDEAVTAGRPRGPLGGLPISIKSAIEVGGLRVETGSPSRRGIVAEND